MQLRQVVVQVVFVAVLAAVVGNGADQTARHIIIKIRDCLSFIFEAASIFVSQHGQC